MLRFGVVVGVDESRGMVRVQYTDMDGEVSYWLAVLKQKTLKDKVYWMPDVGEHVAVLIDENAEEGVVLGAIYSSADSVPVSNKDKCHIKFEDGTWIEYDRAEHKLRAEIQGDIDVKATGRCDLDCQSQIYIKSASNITIQAPTINMKGGSPAEGWFEGNFRLIGNLEVQGNIYVTGSIIDEGGNTNHHSH
ncbi:putative phage baseplate component [Thermodesulfovibrio sp. N1]|uniref:phage baseplate assembly protein V n=1 Tax=unclassified Thermodesulfovibrio TaxID=2645936 RepID=UPI00083B76BC|nr:MULTISPECIES: phage baseplate assembly protein V [unclassified Thermodesulfovibrio]MDI1471935.1 phage baseplate assembly protein V [Thermodesulfovibrio sp. 1176]ODA44238.1 putative phage baseplate component [Thermodesulfovibrio sp. N1]